MTALILDTETTGLNKSAEIVEIGIIDKDTGAVVFESLVRPFAPIPDDATAIHGITNAMVENAPTWAEIHEQVQAVLNSCSRLYIYNSGYDIRLLMQTAALYDLTLDLPWTHLDIPEENRAKLTCVMLWNTELDSWEWGEDSRWQKLGVLADQYGYSSTGKAHRAIEDCLMTRHIIPFLEKRETDRARRIARDLKRYEYQQAVRERKMALVPKGVYLDRKTRSVCDLAGNNYKYYIGGVPFGFKSLSTLRIKDIPFATFKGLCTSAYGDIGYVFEVAEKTD